MDVLIYKDQTVDADLVAIASGISNHRTIIKCQVGQAAFNVPTTQINYPETYSRLSGDLLSGSRRAELAVCLTKIRYDNNYFFQYRDNIAITSLYAWEQLTSLPVNNGVVYLILVLLSRRLGLPKSHRRTTGCINDFNADKTAVDIGMRAAFICPECIRSFEAATPSANDRLLFDGLRFLLDELSAASRANIDIVQYWRSKASATEFDVFLCHNSQDKPEVRNVCAQLRAAGVRPWLDEEQLRPGLPWQVALENQIAAIGAAAVFVGASNLGPWQSMEFRSFLDEFVRRACPVIPVLLPTVQSPPELPIFLRQMTWVDLRREPEVGLERLIWGITGRRPEQGIG